MDTLRYRYQTNVIGDHDIHYRCLRDKQQYEDNLGIAEQLGISSASWPLFGVVWPSGEVMANLMCDYDIEGKRILEIGCGIGLASLVLNERLADVSATDIHPNASDFLQHNTQLNNKRHIPFLRTAWEDSPDENFGHFDLIIGSDLLYEQQHAKHLAMFVQNMANPRCEVLYADGGRGYANKFTFRMNELGFGHGELTVEKPLMSGKPYPGKLHRYRRNM